jgi:hypothetical protein
MSQQRIYVDLETLARIVGDTNNDLAQLMLTYAREQSNTLQEHQQQLYSQGEVIAALREQLRNVRQGLPRMESNAELALETQEAVLGYKLAIADVRGLLGEPL